MKKMMKIVVALAMALVTMVSMLSCASAETYYHTRSVDKVTEEVIGGVMTGNKIVIGTVQKAVGEVDCDIDLQEWYRSRKTAQSTLFDVLTRSFTENSVTWRADIVYYSQVYVYMGSSSPCGDKKNGSIRKSLCNQMNI